MQYQLRDGESHLEGIVHYVRTRAASGGKPLAALRAAGSTSDTGGRTLLAMMGSPLAVR
jgi:hypothetical protein